MLHNYTMKTKQAEKQSSSIRLTLDAKRLLRAIALASGLSMSAVLETLIRDRAKRDGLR